MDRIQVNQDSAHAESFMNWAMGLGVPLKLTFS